MSLKTILVFGATGQQGGSVVRWLLTSPKSSYSVRAVTRDPSKPAAQALLQKHGSDRLEVVSADLNDEASLDKVFQGVYGAFGVTQVMEARDQETAQGIRLADAAKRAGVQHYVWSTLPNYAKRSGGKYPNVFPFDNKAQVDDHIRKIGFANNTTFYFAPGFFENLHTSYSPQKQADGTWVTSLPISPTATVPHFSAVSDTGGFILGIFNAGKAATNTTVIGKAGDYSIATMVEAVGRVAGVDAKFVEAPGDQFMAKMKAITGNDVMGRTFFEMFRVCDEFGYAPAETASAEYWAGDKKPLSIEEWAKTQDWSKFKA